MRISELYSFNKRYWNHLKLQLPNRTQNDIIKFVMIYLNCTLLCQALYTLLELLRLQGVHRAHTAEQLGREGRQWLEKELFLFCLSAYPQSGSCRVVNTDGIACNGSFHGFSVIRHQMCGLAQLHLLACTGKGYAHPSGKRTGADAEECQSVTVRRVHVRLNFENETAEEIIIGVDLACSSLSSTGSGRPFQEMMQEGRYTKIRQCRAEEYGDSLPSLIACKSKGCLHRPEAPSHYAGYPDSHQK